MLLGTQIYVYTNHKNLTHKLSQYVTQHVLHWCLLLEEFSPTFHYLKGPDNVITNALSHVPTSLVSMLSHATSSVPNKLPIRPVTKLTDTLATIEYEPLAKCLRAMPMSERPTESLSNDVAHNDCLPAFYHNCNLSHHDFDPQHNLPFHFSTIHLYQTKDSSLQALLKTNNAYFSQKLGTHNIICHKASSSLSDWKIASPSNMLHLLILWYYKTLSPSSRMDCFEALLKRNFFHPQTRSGSFCHLQLPDCSNGSHVLQATSSSGPSYSSNYPVEQGTC